MWLSSWVTDNGGQLYFPKADVSRRYTQLISFISCQCLTLFVEKTKNISSQKPLHFLISLEQSERLWSQENILSKAALYLVQAQVTLLCFLFLELRLGP